MTGPAPKRVKMRRDRPWRPDHPDAVICARPGRWGNPSRHPPAMAVQAFAQWLDGCPAFVSLYGPPPALGEIRDALGGRDLACWCDLGGPCHADVLLHVANASDDAAARDLIRAGVATGPYPAPASKKERNG